MIHHNRSISLAGLLLVGLFNSAAAAPDYAIQLVRKATVGEHFDFVANSSQEQSIDMSVDGQAMPAKAETTKVWITAAGEVLALTPAGREKKARFVIEKAVVAAGGPWTQLLPPGTEVVAEQTSDKTEFLVGGVPATPEVAKALDIAGIELTADDSINDEQIFGTKDRKKVGESWSINAKDAAAGLAKKGVLVEPGNVTGTATLAEVVKAGNQDALRIAGTLAMKKVNMPLPPGMVVKSSEFNAAFSGLFPVDPTKRVLHSQMVMGGKSVCAGMSDDKELAMTITIKQSKDTKFSAK
jgi:hypothetical protein